jgi:hypothetical protein
MKLFSFLFLLICILLSAAPCDKHLEPVGFEIHGDFNGDGKKEHAKSGTIRQFYLDKKKETNWMVHFSDSTIPKLMIGCCLTYLIAEGDLDKDGKDEFSIFQLPNTIDYCAYYITTYTLKKNKWEVLAGPFPAAQGCEGFTQQYLLDKVVSEGKKKVYYTVDTGKTIQKIKIK